MAENTSYIGVAMGLDVTDLKAGLSEANKQIQLANSEFRAATAGMEDWTRSAEGLTAKVKQLDAVLTAQKSKLAGLQAEYDRVAREQGESSEAARNLQIQINNQRAVVSRTEQEFNAYTQTLAEVEAGTVDLSEVTIKGGKAVKQMGDEADSAGGKLDGLKGFVGGVVGGIAALGAAAVAAVGSFLSLAESTREFREDMSKLTASFEGAELSAEAAKSTYTDLFKVIGESDTAVEAAQQIALLADSEEQAAKWAALATGVTATFGDALKPETFYEAANETIKLGEATGAFTQMLEGTGVSVDEFNAELAACTTEQEKQAYMLKVSEQAMGAAGKAYEESAGDIMSAREAEAELTLALAELGEIAEPIMTTLKLLAVDLLKEMKPFIELIGNGLTGALKGSEGATDQLAEGLSGLISTLLEKVVGMLPTLVTTLVSLIATLLPQVISTIVGFIPTLLSTLAEQIPVILTAIVSAVTQIISQIGAMLPTLIPVIIEAVLTIVETLLNNIDKIIDAGIKLLIGLADGLIKALPKLIDKIPIIIDKLISALTTNLPKIVEMGVELIVKLAVGLIKAIPQLVSKIPQIITSFVSGFADYYSNLGEVGLGLLEGIWDGITGGADWLKEKITGFAGDVAGWFKKTFKINSPSKLMSDEVGQYIGEGIGVGVLDSIPTVKKQLGKFAGFVQTNLGGIKSGLSINAAPAGAGAQLLGGGTVINAGMTVNYNGKLSRRMLRKTETQHYTSVRTKLKAEGAI